MIPKELLAALRTIEIHTGLIEVISFVFLLTLIKAGLDLGH